MSYHFVLIRGLARCHCHWHTFPKLLEKKIEGSKVSFLDLPSMGTRNHLDFSLNMKKNVDAIRQDYKEIISNKDPSLQPIIISISLGSMVNMAWAARYPKDFQKMILINSSSADVNPVYRLQPFALKCLTKALLTLKEKDRERIAFELTSSMAPKDEIISEWAKCSQTYPMSKRSVLRQLLMASRFKCPQNITQDTLVLTARNDRLCNYKCSFEIHDKIKGSRLEFHPSAGHDIPLDDPMWVIEKIKLFLN